MQEFVSILEGLRPSSMFLGLSRYENTYHEVADYQIVFHIDYKRALTKSLDIIKNIKTNSDLEVKAKNDLINSYQKSIDKITSTPVEEIEDGYTRFFNKDGEHIKGIKKCSKTNDIHLYGFVVNKRLIMPGDYPDSNKKDLTIVKDKFRKQTPLSKFRQFVISPSRVDKISVQGLEILPKNYF
jgi:hypothetical protein